MDTYEKKYKGALERAKDYYKANQKLGDSDENEVLSDIFPELKESSEEKVRKEIIKLVKFYYGSSLALKHTVSKDEMVAWLERQKTSEEAIKYLEENHSPSEISDFQEAMNIAVAKAYDRGRKDAERQGEPFDGNIITHDDDVLQAISAGLTDIVEDFGWSDFGGIPIEEILDWLEKQGESKLAGCEDDRIRKWLVGTIKQIPDSSIEWETISKSDVLAWLEKQGEQKPTVDFKAEDWYVSKVDGKIHNMTHSPNNKDEKSKWTDEDDNMLDKIVNSLIDSKYVDSVNYNIMYDWLNSIKQRMEE